MLHEVISEVSKNLARGWSFSEVGSATREQLELMALELYHCNSNKALEMVSVPGHIPRLGCMVQMLHVPKNGQRGRDSVLSAESVH